MSSQSHLPEHLTGALARLYFPIVYHGRQSRANPQAKVLSVLSGDKQKPAICRFSASVAASVSIQRVGQCVPSAVFQSPCPLPGSGFPSENAMPPTPQVMAQACAARNSSAICTAIAPSATAVTTWRSSFVLTSPTAYTPGIRVSVVSPATIYPA